MLLRWLACALLAVVALAAAHTPVRGQGLLDLEGKYRIEGWDQGHPPAGEPDYVGSAMLTQWGKTLRYHGYMDDMTYAGAGIYDQECGTLSLSFTNGDGSERGVTVLRIKEDHLEGRWAMDNGGDGEMGYEIWTRY